MKVNVEEIQELLNITGNYQAVYEYLGINRNVSKTPACFIIKRQDLYEVFKTYHHHDIYEIIYVKKGDIDFYIEEKKYQLTDGDLLLIPPNVLHKLVFTKGNECKRYIINFTKEYCNKFLTTNTNILTIFNLITEKGMHKISLFPEKRKKFETIFESMSENCFSNEYGDDLKFAINFAEIMLTTNRIYMNLPEKDLIQENINDPYVTKIIEYINEHISEKITLDDIASNLSLSISRISHLFKNLTGTSIVNYIIKKRLVMSKELLKSGETIKKTCYKCGFPDETSFFKYFKQEFNITPKKYILTQKNI